MVSASPNNSSKSKKKSWGEQITDRVVQLLWSENGNGNYSLLILWIREAWCGGVDQKDLCLLTCITAPICSYFMSILVSNAFNTIKVEKTLPIKALCVDAHMARILHATFYLMCTAAAWSWICFHLGTFGTNGFNFGWVQLPKEKPQNCILLKEFKYFYDCINKFDLSRKRLIYLWFMKNKEHCKLPTPSHSLRSTASVFSQEAWSFNI